MPFPATAYKVMIASPGDVSDERKIARDIIIEWNDIHSLNRGIVLLPSGWEYNVAPAMGMRAQAHINNTVLKDADILIGIFWTRIGTPTGTSLSGTVEEIDEHIKSGKPTMLYFSNKPIGPNTVDPTQYLAVCQLKRDYQKQGLTWDFDSSEDFKNKFRSHLALKLNQDSYFARDESITSSISSILTVEAKDLLVNAAKDKDGRIVITIGKGVYTINSNKVEYDLSKDTRIKALYETAIYNLHKTNLIKTNDWTLFEITSLGFKIADNLKKS